MVFTHHAPPFSPSPYLFQHPGADWTRAHYLYHRRFHRRRHHHPDHGGDVQRSHLPYSRSAQIFNDRWRFSPEWKSVSFGQRPSLYRSHLASATRHVFRLHHRTTRHSRRSSRPSDVPAWRLGRASERLWRGWRIGDYLGWDRLRFSVGLIYGTEDRER